MIVWRTRGDYRTVHAVLEAIIAFSAMHTYYEQLLQVKQICLCLTGFTSLCLGAYVFLCSLVFHCTVFLTHSVLSLSEVLYELLNRSDHAAESSSLCVLRTQAQYVFIHDVIKYKLESLGYGMTSSANDDDDDDDDAISAGELYVDYSN